MRTVLTRLICPLLLLLSGAPLTEAGAATGELMEVEVRAGYLYHFTKFIEWPAEALPEKAVLTFCIWDDEQLAGVLEAVVRNRSAGPHALGVRRVHGPAEVIGCHVVYLSEASQQHKTNQTQQFLTSAAGRQTLTVGEGPRSAPQDCLVYFVCESNRMAFAFRPALLSLSYLKISSKLLRLSHVR